jgi:hypothetical protein
MLIAEAIVLAIFLVVGVGALVLIGFYLSGRRPELAGLSQGDTP